MQIIPPLRKEIREKMENPQKSFLPSRKEVCFRPTMEMGGKSEERGRASPPSLAPSASSSPSHHEFSFTISLHPSAMTSPEKGYMQPPSPAPEMSPAGHIFSGGRLLPLDPTSHNIHPTPTGSMEVKRFDGKSNGCHDTGVVGKNSSAADKRRREGSKSKASSIFGLPKWKKASRIEIRDRADAKNEEMIEMMKKKKSGLDFPAILKRYINLIKPFFSNGGRKGRREMISGQPHSASGNLNSKMERGGRREASAPASMWASPRNSGLRLATSGMASPSESTIDELQNAIQAAIAHCKNSNIEAVQEEDKHQTPA